MLGLFRYAPFTLTTVGMIASVALGCTFSFHWFWLAVPLLLLAGLGFFDLFHPRNSLLRNYPLLAYGRFLSEEVRPEIQQYFVENDIDGKPLSRNQRQQIYERAHREHQEVSFGTELDVYAVGYEWLNHSIAPRKLNEEQYRVSVGGDHCKIPYAISLLNISSMSFGSLSANAILALNGGARLGEFAHATGEGGISRYHLEPGGDLIWEIGTAYFGCRTDDGRLDPNQFARKACQPTVKCITVKLSQGAKPGLGGVMPAAKMSEEIASVRGVHAHVKCVSPPGHCEFDSPIGMLEFLQRLRELSEGKPVGFKLCVGHRSEFLGICKAMIETGILPDYIIVDGGEGGTAAAPLEFEDRVGAPLTEGLHFVHQSLVACGLRDKIRIGCSGKVTSAFEITQRLIQGADFCNAARAMMLALGCIQAQRCETNRCPTGIATQDASRARGLRPAIKERMVRNYHHSTIVEFNQLIASMGLDCPSQLKPHMLMRRTGPASVASYGELYYQAKRNELIDGTAGEFWNNHWEEARSDSF